MKHATLNLKRLVQNVQMLDAWDFEAGSVRSGTLRTSEAQATTQMGVLNQTLSARGLYV